MAHKLYMDDDGILRMGFIGDVDLEAVTAWHKDVMPFIEAVDEETGLDLLIDASREGKMSRVARRTFTKVNDDQRLKKIAVVNINRFNRVMAIFIMKATGRNNICFFDTDEEALVWLKE